MDAYDRARMIAERDRIRAIVRAKMDEDEVRGAVVYDPPRRRKGRYPSGGNSETIMRNRILRAKSFGLDYGYNTYEG